MTPVNRSAPARIAAITAAPLLLAPVAVAQAQPAAAPPTAPATTPAGSPAVQALLRQAERWLTADRPDLAAPPIERALAAEPNNPAVLAAMARLEIARGNPEAANAALARLRATGATSEAAAIEGTIRASTLDRGALEDARRLAREGRTAAAATRYRGLFGNAPPDAFAVEYWSTLAGNPATREEGVRNLGRLADRPGAPAAVRLAYAQALTYDPATRTTGISRLSALADVPEVAAEARRSWAAALGFAGNDPAAIPLLEAYAQRYPDDTETRGRLESLRAARAASVADPSALARQGAFQRLEAGNLSDSARRFEEVLRTNPNDPDALGGLGIVRLREGNAAEARRLLERAVATAPDGGRAWQRALDGASYGAELADGRARLRRGDLAGAEEVARRAALRDVEDRSDAEVLLGDIALRRGDPTAAETRYRAALARRPGHPPAQSGVNAALRAQNRPAEFRTAESSGGTPRAEARDTLPPAAASFRAEAARTTDPNAAAALLRAAVAAAPDDPWVRLDLARALRRAGHGAEGRALVDELAIRGGTPDAAFAAALLAEEDGRAADADAFLARVPPNRRSPDMARLAARVRGQREVAAAAALLPASPIEGRSRLLVLAARPDPTGSLAAAVIRAFGDRDDRAGAAEAARVASVANRGAPSARVAVAGALLSAGLENEATALAAEIEASGASPEVRRDLAALRSGAAVRAADRLNEAGDQAAAFERLRPALAFAPDSSDAQLALARLYVGARRPAEALRVAEAVLARDPRNLDARRAAIEAALAAGDRRRAETLLAEAQAAGQRDSRLYLLEARVARAAGDGPRARTALEAASRQREAELGPGAAATPVADLSNPFARGAIATPGAPADRLTRDIQTEWAAVREELGPSVAGLVGGRLRSGDQGLDRLTEVSGRLEAVLPAPALGGRFTVAAEPVALDSGSLSNTSSSRNRFGTLVLGSGTTRLPDSTASGVGLNLAYARGDWLRLDVGSTPLGFPRANVVGGLEIAPRLTDGGLRLRLVGERRAVTDSLLSWAGQTDPASGTSWGRVIRTGGRGQVEVPVGPGYLYAGGGYARFEGDRVASNSRVEAGAGLSFPVYRAEGAEVSTGADLVYLSYDRNLRYFTLGHGGYFSPQQYVALNIPVDYRGRTGDLSYRLGGTVGYASWREDAAPLFPTDPARQSAVEALAAAAGTGSAIQTGYRGQSQSGFVGGVRADLDWAITDTLTLGAAARYEKAASFDETRFQIRLRNRF